MKAYLSKSLLSPAVPRASGTIEEWNGQPILSPVIDQFVAGGRYAGHVKWWDAHKGCGHITVPGLGDVFAHFTAARSKRKVFVELEPVEVVVTPPPAGKKCWEASEVWRREVKLP